MSEREHRLLTADELADRWQVPKGHVYRLTREGAITVVKLGRYYRYLLSAVEAFERNGGFGVGDGVGSGD